MEATNRIDFVIETLNLNRSEFSRRIGVPEYKIKDISRGKVLKISVDIANAICREFPQFSYTWLLNGEGDPIFEKEEKINNTNESVLMNKDVVSMISTLSEAIKQTQETLMKSQEVLQNMIQVQENTIKIMCDAMKQNQPVPRPYVCEIKKNKTDCLPNNETA